MQLHRNDIFCLINQFSDQCSWIILIASLYLTGSKLVIRNYVFTFVSVGKKRLFCSLKKLIEISERTNVRNWLSSPFLSSVFFLSLTNIISYLSQSPVTRFFSLFALRRAIAFTSRVEELRHRSVRDVFTKARFTALCSWSTRIYIAYRHTDRREYKSTCAIDKIQNTVCARARANHVEEREGTLIKIAPNSQRKLYAAITRQKISDERRQEKGQRLKK